MNPCPCGEGVTPGGVSVLRPLARALPPARSRVRCSTGSTCGSRSTGPTRTTAPRRRRASPPPRWPSGSPAPGPVPPSGACGPTPSSPGRSSTASPRSPPRPAASPNGRCAQGRLSARGLQRVRRVALTLADLAGHEGPLCRRARRRGPPPPHRSRLRRRRPGGLTCHPNRDSHPRRPGRPRRRPTSWRWPGCPGSGRHASGPCSSATRRPQAWAEVVRARSTRRSCAIRVAIEPARRRAGVGAVPPPPSTRRPTGQQHVRAGVGVAVAGSAPSRRPSRPTTIRPAVLFWHGDLDHLAGARVAVVGTRKATRYGHDVAVGARTRSRRRRHRRGLGPGPRHRRRRPRRCAGRRGRPADRGGRQRPRPRLPRANTVRCGARWPGPG